MSDKENTMEILIASDLHLGYLEKDPVRGKDSFNALEEVLKIADEKKVDFILLGGDLFHINKPSKNTLYTTLDLLEKYCLGDRECKVKVVSNEAINFGTRHASKKSVTVNYKNPNMKISIPVFSIHGNHDDNTGVNTLSAIDIVSVAGLLNHFGKQNSTNFQISPVLLEKGTTKLALYGLGSIRDGRLFKLFDGDSPSVTFKRLKDQQEWFNIFVLHQNRAQYNVDSYMKEEFIDDFFDLVIWGHEHECKIIPEESKVKPFKIVQPGSTVATQIRESESKPKHAAILHLKNGGYFVEKIALRTVRQMYIEKIVLSAVVTKQFASEKAKEDEVKKVCRNRIDALLEKARRERHPSQPVPPIIQLKIDYSNGFEIFNRHQFGEEYRGKVANHENVIHFLKCHSFSSEGDGPNVMDVDIENVSLEDLVHDYLSDKEKQMALLKVRDMSEAVENFVNKQEANRAIFESIENRIRMTQNHMFSYNGSLDRNAIACEIRRFAGTENMIPSGTTAVPQTPTYSVPQASLRPTTSGLTPFVQRAAQTMPQGLVKSSTAVPFSFVTVGCPAKIGAPLKVGQQSSSAQAFPVIQPISSGGLPRFLSTSSTPSAISSGQSTSAQSSTAFIRPSSSSRMLYKDIKPTLKSTQLPSEVIDLTEDEEPTEKRIKRE